MASLTPSKRSIEALDGDETHAPKTAEETRPKRARSEEVAAVPSRVSTIAEGKPAGTAGRGSSTSLKRPTDGAAAKKSSQTETEQLTLPSPPAAVPAQASTHNPVVAFDDQDEKPPLFVYPNNNRSNNQDEATEMTSSVSSQSTSQRSVSNTASGSVLNDEDCDPYLLDPMGDIDDVDRLYKRAAAITATCWVLLLMTTYYIYNRWTFNHDTQLALTDDDAIERRVPQTAFFILLVSTVLQMVPFFLAKLKPTERVTANSPSAATSGIMISALVILSISLLTNALLAWGPPAVVIDPVTGSRVFLLRWVEWIPLSGLMTLLAESADIPTHEGAWKKPIIFALCQVLSTLCGIVFPYCQSTSQWVVVMVFSCILFLPLFPRVHARSVLLQKTPPGKTVLEREYYDRRRFAYFLMVLCSILWSTLVILYFINLAIHMLTPAGHWLRFHSLAMSFDTLFDVSAKVVYNKIIFEAHQAVFASDLRTIRQLSELKQLMSMLWVSSSDVIVISNRQTEHRKATMLSPSFLQLIGANPPLKTSTNPQEDDQMDTPEREGSDECPKHCVALVLVTEQGKATSAYYVDTSNISGDLQTVLAYEDLRNNAVVQALRITNTAWSTRHHNVQSEQEGEEGAPLRALSIVHSDPSRTGKVMCEMKVCRHTSQTAMAVVRDVSERYRRFEAESRAHAETIARQREMHTVNRFTRHEVKNGLLSGIELCSTLQQSLNELKGMLKEDEPLPLEGVSQVQGILQQGASHLNNKSFKSLVDLDSTLRGVLDTVLAEVMAREVVHEVYQPKLEELDVPSMLVSNLGMSKDSIPVIVRGGSMPKLLLDAQLIGHIHRNAVSNACKYGKSGGKVQTFVEYDVLKKEFRMEVTNEPGPFHDDLLALGSSASEFVFAQGVRLQPHMKGKTEKKLDSSGDGAWIMQKCAKTMHGVCNIYFLQNLTRFTLHCPAALYVAQSSQPDYKDFVLPENVWGIGIDDSKIQRKLLSRILTHAGVKAARQLLLGETHEDVIEFESTLMNLMDGHPTMKFLVIVDEHLDYDNLSMRQQDGVHSGSLIMKQILENIPKQHLARLLVLMRSANDSAMDIALYTQRTHGYFPKTIMQRERTREILGPLWLSRFPEQ